MIALFRVWFGVGLFGFGGGPAFVPLIREECVDRRGWLTDAEFLDALALGNALPGPISLKLAAHVGRRVAGWPGALVSTVAVSLPGIVLMVVIAAVWARYRAHPAVAGLSRGVRPAVIGLCAYTTWVLVPDGVRDVWTALLAVAAFLALLVDVHPAIVIAVAAVIGAIALR